MTDLEAHKARVTPGLMQQSGVLGVGITEHAGAPALLVLVDLLTNELRLRVMALAGDEPVVIEQVGSIVAAG